jgi:hypothetical protein
VLLELSRAALAVKGGEKPALLFEGVGLWEAGQPRQASIAC